MIAGHFGKRALVMALSVALIQGCSYIKLKGSESGDEAMEEDVSMRPATLPEPEAVSLPHLPTLPETTMNEPQEPPMGISGNEGELGYAPAAEAEPVAMPAPVEPAVPAAVYSLQLLGTTNMLSAQKFIDDHGLGDSATIGATTYKGNAWFVVLYGSYQTADEARAGRAELPAKIQGMKPWPRKLDTL